MVNTYNFKKLNVCQTWFVKQNEKSLFEGNCNLSNVICCQNIIMYYFLFFVRCVVKNNFQWKNLLYREDTHNLFKMEHFEFEKFYVNFTRTKKFTSLGSMETVLWRYSFDLAGKIRSNKRMSICVDLLNGMFEYAFLVNIVRMK